MALKIEAPEIERKLRKNAARRGVATEAYVLQAVSTYMLADEDAADTGGEPSFPRTVHTTATPRELKDALRQWAGGFPAGTPLIPDEALRRENLYDDRWL